MPRHSIHTTKRPDGKWGNVSAGASKAPKHYDTKAEAQAAGRQTSINQKAEHVIHGVNGRIQGSNSYGNDPNPPKE